MAGAAKNVDGIGIYTANLCDALKNKNIDVHKIYFKRPNEIFRPITAPQRKNFYVASSPLCSLLPGNFYNNIKNKMDLIHITDFLAPRMKGLPTVLTLHDAFMLKNAEWLTGSKIRNYLKGCIAKKLSQHADHVMTCSYASVPDIINFWGIPEHKISVVHYGLSEIWRQSIEEKIQQMVLKKYQLTKPFFLTVGTLQPRKNIERTINAFLKLPRPIIENFNLVIVGKPHATVTPPSLLEKIHRLESTGQLFWLKYIPFEDLRSLYQSAQLLLYPSLAEGFGFPILEGFASATPVITSQGSSTAEIAGGAAYLVDPYSEEAISAAILKITEQPDTRNQLIQKGLLQVKNFTWQTCAQRTIEVYKRLI